MNLIIFDNGRNFTNNSRAGSQKAMGFIADGGVSDMLCQILVQARSPFSLSFRYRLELATTGDIVAVLHDLSENSAVTPVAFAL